MPVAAPKPAWSDTAKPDEIMREVRKAFEELAQNVTGFAVGSIYVQYPGQDEPKAVFGGSWLNITSMYAGLFFRAEGGDASTFNSGTQAWDAGPHQHLTGVGTTLADAATGIYGSSPLDIPGLATRVVQSAVVVPSSQGVTSKSFYSGAVSTVTELRPINQSIRIWKRSA